MCLARAKVVNDLRAKNIGYRIMCGELLLQ